MCYSRVTATEIPPDFSRVACVGRCRVVLASLLDRAHISAGRDAINAAADSKPTPEGASK